MRLIWVDAKAEYFCAEDLTRFLKIRSDLPVVLICRRSCTESALARQANQPAVRRVGKAQACPPLPSTVPDGGLSAIAPSLTQRSYMWDSDAFVSLRQISQAKWKAKTCRSNLGLLLCVTRLGPCNAGN